MVDVKMITKLLNCGGAYCTMCVKTQAECQDPETIKAGFVIKRDVQGIKDPALALADEEMGDVVHGKGNYFARHCICRLPITETDLTKNIPVCHSKIRAFQWTIDLVVHYLSHKKWWTTTNKVKYSKEEKDDYKI